jgi:D-alanyl-D-alanine carboxypeptidase
VNRATSFRVASITKTFTATAVLQLVDDGRLALDATIEAWAPRLAYADRITVRDLLGMTSGIPDEGGPGSLLSELAGDDPTRVWAPEEVIDLAVLDEVLQGPTPPGSYEYSDANYALLGIIAESVTGQPIDELVRRRILRPLHLRHTSFPASGLDMPSPGATGYGIEFPEGAVSPATVVDASVYGAAGAMISTLGDMERWARALATGALLSPAMQQERLRLTEDIAEFPPLPGFGGQPVFGGYGLGILSVDGYLGHNGVVNGFMSELFHDPATGTSIVVLLNGETILTSGDDEELLPIADALFVTLADVVAGTP